MAFLQCRRQRRGDVRQRRTLRCAIRLSDGIVRKPRMAFRTLAGIIKAELLGDRVKVQMTSPHSLQLDLNLEADGKSFHVDSVNTGVPHAVCFAADESELESIDVLRYGHALRFHEHFQPAGSNANFVHVQDSHHMVVRTFERGVEGETLAVRYRLHCVEPRRCG